PSSRSVGDRIASYPLSPSEKKQRLGPVRRLKTKCPKRSHDVVRVLAWGETDEKILAHTSSSTANSLNDDSLDGGFRQSRHPGQPTFWRSQSEKPRSHRQGSRSRTRDTSLLWRVRQPCLQGQP